MVQENFSKALRAFAGRAPFKPFVVELVSGDRVLVEHPEALAFRGGTAVYINPHGEYSLFDHGWVAQVLDPPPSKRKSS